MKAKIFSKLKQEYSSLGLGDDLLQGRAEALAKSGYVTDENIDLIVSYEKDALKLIQKENDRRVSAALDKQRKEMEEEAAKKAKEVADAEEEAKKKAEAEAKLKAEEEAKRIAEEESRKKAEAEALAAKEAADKLAQLEKDKKIPEDFLNFFKAEKERAEKERKEFEERLAQMQSTHLAEVERYNKTLEAVTAVNSELKTNLSTLQTGYDALNSENEANKLAAKVRAREEFILGKAKELGIPEWRINEGFSIKDDMDESSISDVLAVVSNNIKTQMLPQGRPSFSMSEGVATDKETSAIADMLVGNF